MPDQLTPVGITLERAVQVTGCPTCGAKPGDPCATRGGRLAPCHAARYEQAKRVVYDRYRLDAWNRSCRG